MPPFAGSSATWKLREKSQSFHAPGARIVTTLFYQNVYGLPNDQIRRAIAMCPVGKKVIGGGFRPDWEDSIPPEIVESAPFDADPAFPTFGPGWAVTARRRADVRDVAMKTNAFAICATIAE